MFRSNFIIASVILTGVVSACSSTRSGKDKPVADKPASTGEKTLDVSYLDKSIRPQDDFFLYANGTWVKNNPVPPSESRWGSFNELEKSNQKKLTDILEKAKNGKPAEGSNEALLGNYYAAYMDTKSREKASWNPIKEDIAKITAISGTKELPGIIAWQHSYGINSLFGFGIDQDLKDIDRNITYIGQSGIGLPNKDYYTSQDKKDILAAYSTHISTMFGMIGKSAEESKTAAEQVIRFETLLAEKMMSPAQLRIPEDSYNKMHLSDLKKTMNAFDMDAYLQSIGSQKFDSLVVGQPLFMGRVNEMIGMADLATWKSYLTWKVLKHYSNHLNEAFVAQHFKFYQGVLTGKTEMKPLNERAINELTGMTIGEVLGQLFVEQYYSDKSQQRVNTMVDNLLLTFGERISDLSWMSAETKKEALNKLNSIGRKLGFPSKWEDFSDLKLTRTDYVANIKLCTQRDVRKNLSELNKPVDKAKWAMPAHMINAYYHPLLNEIAFPAGIMQPPFFDVNAEDAVNYGRIGMVIGHEFTHGFDDMGSKFAADGSFTNWWTETDRKLFEERTNLLGQTFASFCPVEGHCVNPDLTMGENIADLGGITLAYYAYTKTPEFKSGELKEGFTPAQRFFLSFAQLWKINYTQAELKNRIANDPHSPGMYRVNGPLMNCPEFFEAFDVKEGDKMRNSSQKISKIW